MQECEGCYELTPEEAKHIKVRRVFADKDSYLRESKVKSIQKDLRENKFYPSICCVLKGGELWIQDGFHRLQAHINENRNIVVQVVSMTFEEVRENFKRQNPRLTLYKD